MSAGDLETIARLRLPVTLVHFNNACFGWIKASQHLLYGGRHFGVDFQSDTDYAAIARGFGLDGVQVEDPAEVEPLLSEALDSGRPAFVDIVTECESTELPPVAKFHRASQDAGG